MKLIAITIDKYWSSGNEAEAKAIVNLLEACVYWRVHIRKPYSTPDMMSDLVDRIPIQFRNRISIHDNFQLAKEYHLGGIHLNRRNQDLPLGWDGIVSVSCHSLEETYRTLNMSQSIDYIFLSPIYDSYSKSDYKSKFDLEDLFGKLPRNVIALGGVSLDRLSALEHMGFVGAAMLTKAWTEYTNYI